MRRERLGESEAKLLVEAMLFASSRPVELRTLMRATGWRSKRELVRLLEELKREYDEQGRAFTVSELPGERYLMHLRNELLPIVRRYQRRSLLSPGTLRTLSFIAYHQPIEMSAVAAVRGSRAYVHVRELEELGLVEVERKGRSKVLRTSQLFAMLIGVEGSVAKIKRVISGLVERERGSGQSGSSGSPPPSGQDQAGPNEDAEVEPVGRT
ncbi:MAG: SMC-Scp complex subunit ScpB [Candidatus Caldarchaeales archaeon]